MHSNCLTPAEIADLLGALKPSDRLRILGLLPSEIVGDEIRTSLIKAIAEKDLIQAAATLDPDDLAYIIAKLPERACEQVIQTLSQTDRRRLEQALSYPEGTAQPDAHRYDYRPPGCYPRRSPKIHSRGELPDLTDSLYVVDGNDRLLGILPFSTLLTCAPNKTVRADAH